MVSLDHELREPCSPTFTLHVFRHAKKGQPRGEDKTQNGWRATLPEAPLDHLGVPAGKNEEITNAKASSTTAAGIRILSLPSHAEHTRKGQLTLAFGVPPT